MSATINIKIISRLSLLVLALLLSYSGIAQSDVSIFGVVRDHDNNKKISGVDIAVYEDDSKFNTVKSNSSGKYEFVIGFDHVYRIVYTYPNYVTKFLTIDTRYVPDEDKNVGYEMNIDMTLFQEIEGLDVSILDNPIGKAQFDQNQGRMGWDMNYTRNMQAQINSLMREHDKKLQEEADRMAKMKLNFEELVRNGDEAVRNQKYSDAVDLYTDALILFPDDSGVKDKKAQAQKAVEAQIANQQKEDKYNTFISSGDTYFGKQEWNDALISYESASELFPDESYPKGRIKEINEKLDAIRQNSANETAVAKLIKDGDNLVGQEEFDGAIGKYEEAIALIPGHKLAIQQLAAAKEKKDAWLVAQEREVNYSNLIAKADGEFNSNDFRKAITTYNSALELKPAEKYPKDQISKAQEIIAKAGAEADKKKEFDELVSQGDAKVNSTAYKEGIDFYNSALTIIPGDATVEQKIKDAQSSLASLLAAGELDDQYKALIAKADKSLASKDYDASKSSYQQALSLKENENYPKQKIAEINGILAGLKASDEASAQKALQAKFDKMVAQGDENVIEKNYDDAIDDYESALVIIPNVKTVEEKIKDVKNQQRALLANKKLDDQYNEWISKADRYFDTKKYEDSKDAYLEALLLFNKDYPKERIAEIDQLIENLAKQSSEAERVAEFTRLEKEGDNFIAGSDFQSAIESYSSALSIMDEQRVVDKKATAEKKLASLSASKANDEQYNSLIAKADDSFNKKEYSSSRSTYQKAFSVKAEDYPKERIKEIDGILIEIERRKKREEQERLASESVQQEWNSNTSDEERYIEEAQNEREKSEDDNYASLLAYKAAVNETNKGYADSGETLRDENASVIASERQLKEDLFTEGEEMHEKNTYLSSSEVEDYNNWLKQKNNEQTSASRSTYNELVNEQSEIEREQSYNSERYKEYAHELTAEKEAYQNFTYSKNQEHDRKIKQNYYQSQEIAAEQYRVFEEGKLRIENMRLVRYEKEDKEQFIYKNKQEQQDRTKDYQDVNNNIKIYQNTLREKDNLEVEESYKEVQNESEMLEVEEERWRNNSDMKRDDANYEARTSDYSGEKNYNDYTAGSLAQQYQQGVTEETYEEGNSKVIKRVVVRGNKADEYKMVVMRSGTYYFKNGYSITKNTWNNETETKSSYLD